MNSSRDSYSFEEVQLQRQYRRLKIMNYQRDKRKLLLCKKHNKKDLKQKEVYRKSFLDNSKIYG